VAAWKLLGFGILFNKLGLLGGIKAGPTPSDTFPNDFAALSPLNILFHLPGTLIAYITHGFFFHLL
jgi:hypothetical protein